jgi:SpoVT / AbrB like domain.
MKLEFGMRKIQAIGDSFFVSIPRPWIRTHKLDQGSRVSVDVAEDGSLKISPPEAARELLDAGIEARGIE